jgi:hypothetical protein
MSVAGNPFWVYQLASVLTDGVVLLAVSLVLRDFFGARAARLGMLLGSLNLWILHNAWFTWSKMLTAYYLVLGLHFYIRWLRAGTGDAKASRRLFGAFWVASLLGFMTHQVAAVYVAALLAHAVGLLVRGRVRRPSVGELAALGLTALAIVAPWFVWLARSFGVRSILLSTPTTTMRTESSVSSLLGFLAVTVHNLVTSVVPFPLIRTIVLGPWSLGRLFIEITALYFCQLPGLLTISLTVFLTVPRLRQRLLRFTADQDPVARGGERGAVLAFAVFGALAAVAIHPGRATYGVAHNAFFPSALVLAVWAWGLLSQSHSRWKPLVIGGIVAEFLIMFWSHLAWIFLHLHFHRIGTDSNWLLKQAHHVVFLFDRLGRAAPLALLAGAVIQARLCLHLAAEIRRDRDRSGGAPDHSGNQRRETP